MIRNLIERFAFARFTVVHRRSLAAQKHWQLKRLQKLLVHAYENIPLTRELMDKVSITPKSIRTLEDHTKLPVTRKQTFIGRMAEEYLDSSQLRQPRWYVTSGTSGTPFRFLMNEMSTREAYVDFASLRFLWWRGESLQLLPKLKIARIKIRGSTNAQHLFVAVEDFLTNPRTTLARLVQFNAAILAAYPSILFDMAQLLEKDSSLPRPKPRYVLSFGEMLSPPVREYVARILECEVYDRYGLEEIGVVGVECALHNGFHINTESVIVEITDDSFTPLPEGEEGRILTTDLFNYGMPFIRYDTGDRGRVTYAACPCGLRSPRLWIQGRYSTYLTFNERRFHHLEFDGAMDGFMNTLLQYQIARVSDSALIARIIPGPAFNPAISHQVKQRLQKLVGSNVAIEVKIVTKLSRTEGGKSRIVCNEAAV